MSYTIREYSLLALGLLAALWFFVGYPSQDPRSTIDLSVEKDSLRQEAERTMQLLGYSTEKPEQNIKVKANQKLLDSLQHNMGRAKLIRQIKEKDIANLNPFFWEVQFNSASKSSKANDQAAEADQQPDEKDMRLRFNMQGMPIELLNDEGLLPDKLINRAALASIFSTDRKQAQQRLTATVDSALSSKFVFHSMQDNGSIRKHPGHAFSRLDTLLSRNRPILLFKEDVFNMASYYLEQTGWETATLRKDTVQLGRSDGVSTATARYQWSDPAFGQDLNISVRLTPTGGLLSLTSAYNPGNNSGQSFHELWPVLRSAVIFLFGIMAVIVFFFRIRDRAIDTQAALIIAVLGGVMVSVQMLLSLFSEVSLVISSGNWIASLFILFGIGIVGAISSLGFFVLTGIGDSITRQHWEGKLDLYDYLRQGMVFNKPIGSMLVRSVLLSFILAGLWTGLLWLFPNLYIDIEHVFQHDRALWPILNLLFHNGWLSLGIVLSIFLVLGGQVYAQTDNETITSAIMILACIIVMPVIGSYGPLLQEMAVAAVIGLALVLIYLAWDLLTLLLSYFLFLGLVSTTTGWVVAQSMDTYIFVVLILLMSTLLLVGIWLAVWGKEVRGLPRFVPDYVEELAQEERIKQELQIARDVQQSFLPARTPQFEQLELAAICKPAYETGGDYYDIIMLDENRVAVTIGDVSGKGIQAAFYMTFVKGILHSLCREIDSPAELLKKANRLFCQNAPRGVFISLVYGIIDLEKEEFRFARAGHNPILHLRKQSEQIKELQPKGIGLGLDDGAPFDTNIEEVKLRLGKEDGLILYTDGIVEALNSNNIFYGSHRLNNILSKNKQESAMDILDAVSNDIDAFIGSAKQHDDMTMVIIKLRR